MISLVVGLLLMGAGFITAVSEPLKDWKVFWGFGILFVGVLWVLYSLI